MKRIIIFLGLVLFFNSSCTIARENLREQFKNNEAIIYTINIRNFASVDKNFDGIIETQKGDKIEVDLANGIIYNRTQNKEYKCTKYEGSIAQLIEEGGLINYTKKKLGV